MLGESLRSPSASLVSVCVMDGLRLCFCAVWILHLPAKSKTKTVINIKLQKKNKKKPQIFSLERSDPLEVKKVKNKRSSRV